MSTEHYVQGLTCAEVTHKIVRSYRNLSYNTVDILNCITVNSSVGVLCKCKDYTAEVTELSANGLSLKYILIVGISCDLRHNLRVVLTCIATNLSNAKCVFCCENIVLRLEVVITGLSFIEPLSSHSLAIIKVLPVYIVSPLQCDILIDKAINNTLKNCSSLISSYYVEVFFCSFSLSSCDSSLKSCPVERSAISFNNSLSFCDYCIKSIFIGYRRQHKFIHSSCKRCKACVNRNLSSCILICILCSLNSIRESYPRINSVIILNEPLCINNLLSKSRLIYAHIRLSRFVHTVNYTVSQTCKVVSTSGICTESKLCIITKSDSFASIKLYPLITCVKIKNLNSTTRINYSVVRIAILRNLYIYQSFAEILAVFITVVIPMSTVLNLKLSISLCAIEVTHKYKCGSLFCSFAAIYFLLRIAIFKTSCGIIFRKCKYNTTVVSAGTLSLKLVNILSIRREIKHNIRIILTAVPVCITECMKT